MTSKAGSDQLELMMGTVRESLQGISQETDRARREMEEQVEDKVRLGHRSSCLGLVRLGQFG